MPRDNYHEQRLAAYDRRVAEFQQKGTFGAAVMLTAIEEAERGALEGEVPVGALVIRENRVIGADANPYVALAMTLACGYLGLKNKILFCLKISDCFLLRFLGILKQI